MRCGPHSCSSTPDPVSARPARRWSRGAARFRHLLHPLPLRPHPRASVLLSDLLMPRRHMILHGRGISPAHDDARDGQRSCSRHGFRSARHLPGQHRLSTISVAAISCAPPRGDNAHRQPQPSGRLHRLPGRVGRPRGGGDHAIPSTSRACSIRTCSELISQADLVVYDCTYTEEEMVRIAAMATRPGSRASALRGGGRQATGAVPP